MVEVAGKNDWAGIHKINKQRLMAGRVTGGRDDTNPAITKHIIVAVYQNTLGVFQILDQRRVNAG